MTEILTINSNATIKEQYELLVKQVRSLLDANDNLTSNLANFTAALKQTFSKISWAGFYLFDGNELYLGPFQGKVACTKIKIGQGVCGSAAQMKKTIIVPDVDKFPGHIACDAESKSEIVVPVLKDGELFGVLDLDSTSLNSFDETDKHYLELMVKYLTEEII